jgi:hypothetical protein
VDGYASGERIDTKGFWGLFAITQLIALILIPFTNVHTNPLPMFFSLAFLLPGILVGYYAHLPDWNSVSLAIPINAAVWYLTRRLLNFAANKFGIQR